MTADELLLRRAVVFASGVGYWAGVFIQARRIRRHIGKSPNVRPRGIKEQALWAGWFLVVANWLGQPLIAGSGALPHWLLPIESFSNLPCLLAGIALIAAGYAATLWCYRVMGDTWRMGIDRAEITALVKRRPYRRVRHPIYLFQTVMLAGAALLF